MLTSGITSGRYPGLGLKAWVLLNGSTGAIIKSFGIASASKPLSGTYQLNFSSAAANTNYMVDWDITGGIYGMDRPGNVPDAGKLTTSFQLYLSQAGSPGTTLNPQNVYIAVYE